MLNTSTMKQMARNAGFITGTRDLRDGESCIDTIHPVLPDNCCIEVYNLINAAYALGQESIINQGTTNDY